MRRPSDTKNFSYLTSALVGILVVGALIETVPGGWSNLVLQVLSVILLLIASNSLHTLNARFPWGYLVIGLMIISATARYFILAAWLDASFVILLLVFFQAAFWTVSRNVLLTGSIDTDKIIGSVAMYLLLGLSWSALYSLVLIVDAGAIAGIPSQSWADNFADTTYFSFVTITTLGYGDLLPVNEFVRVIAYLEAVTGVFFMAIVVASLINKSVGDSTHKKHDSFID